MVILVVLVGIFCCSCFVFCSCGIFIVVVGVVGVVGVGVVDMDNRSLYH